DEFDLRRQAFASQGVDVDGDLACCSNVPDEFALATRQIQDGAVLGDEFLEVIAAQYFPYPVLCPSLLRREPYRIESIQFVIFHHSTRPRWSFVVARKNGGIDPYHVAYCRDDVRQRGAGSFSELAWKGLDADLANAIALEHGLDRYLGADEGTGRLTFDLVR